VASKDSFYHNNYRIKKERLTVFNKAMMLLLTIALVLALAGNLPVEQLKELLKELLNVISRL
jgi:hypothetical protein